jgi:DNA invertase Pin-like site-specific DNA recombinase
MINTSQSAANAQDCGLEQTMSNNKLTILYLRLSKDDDLQLGESNSITNQRKLLTEYADRNGFTPYECLTDDGRTGTNFDRPGWQELMTKVDADEVSTIILKSLDRMGRNYLESGMFRELFASKGIRLIAVNDGIDTFDHDDDFVPFREIMAEYYARDTSRKIKSSLNTKGKEGKPLTNHPPYGFDKDPNNKNLWVPEEPAASVVRRIFQMTIDGIGPYQIARTLHNEGIERPSYYLTQRGRGNHRANCDDDNPCAWKGAVVREIIARPEYAGHTVNFRTSRASFKTKTVIHHDSADWQFFENTHPAIVPQETWDLAQELRKTIRRNDSLGEPYPLTGLMYCYDCKSKMYSSRKRQTDKKYKAYNGKYYAKKQTDQYICSRYNIDREKFNEPSCTGHFISTSAVYDIIRDILCKTNGYVREHESDFIAKVRETSALRQGETVKSQKKVLSKNERRISELDKLITGLYESMMKELINEERFKQMSENYEREQRELKEQNAEIQKELDAFTADSVKADKYVELVRRFTNFEELTPAIIYEFIDRIEVHDNVWSERDPETGYKGSRSQEVDVYLKYIGKFDVPDNRTSEDIEAERIAEEKLRRRRESNRKSQRKRIEAQRAAELVEQTAD